MRQIDLRFPRSAEASAALDACLAALDDRAALDAVLAALPRHVWLELDALGDIDEIDAMERQIHGEPNDWADPDSFDAKTEEWYDRFASPYAVLGGDDLEADRQTCEFFLGTHRPHWLYAGSRKRRPEGPLFVSARQISHARHTSYPLCDTRFSVDSGGFTEIRRHGGWVTTPQAYAAQVMDLDAHTGTLDWAACQDWMVEDDALRSTGLTVEEHQQRTIASFLELRRIAPWIRWLPVLQGQTLEQYEQHIEMYRAAGVHLSSMGLVGVGSVCRRQGSDEIAEILRALHARGLRLHGFGVKTDGLAKAAKYLWSADSLAWSLAARKQRPGAQNCQNEAEMFRTKMCTIEGVSGRVVHDFIDDDKDLCA